MHTTQGKQGQFSYFLANKKFFWTIIFLIKNDLDKHLSKKINDSKITLRFDDFMSSLSNE